MKIFIKYLLMVLLCACTKNIAPGSYISWVNNPTNGLIVSKEIGDYQFIFHYKPLAYLAFQEYKSDTISKNAIEKYKEKTDGFQYYTLEIATKDKKTDVLRKNIQTINEYYGRIQYFSTVMQDDLILQDGDEMVHCSLFQFERDYGISPYQRFIIGFKLPDKSPGHLKNKKDTDKTLIFNDKVLGVGKVELTIKGKSIKELSKLKLSI